MNPTILRLSTQALLGRRRGLVLMLIPAVLLGLAVVVRALTEDTVGYEAVVNLGFTLALPLVALLAAMSALTACGNDDADQMAGDDANVGHRM